MTPPASLLPVLQALLLPAIGVVLTGVGIWVAVQQMRLARLKTQHELFDRRFAIYLATLDLFGGIVTMGRVQAADRNRFDAERLKADFVLSSNLASYLRDEVWDHMIKLEQARHRVERRGADWEQALADEGVEVAWFAAELSSLRLRFREDMNLLP